jgi:hypothetical protein
VTDRSEIVIGDGVPRLAVDRVEEGAVICRVRSPGLNRTGVIARWRCQFGVVGPTPTTPEVGPSYKAAV